LKALSKKLNPNAKEFVMPGKFSAPQAHAPAPAPAPAQLGAPLGGGVAMGGPQGGWQGGPGVGPMGGGGFVPNSTFTHAGNAAAANMASLNLMAAQAAALPGGVNPNLQLQFSPPMGGGGLAALQLQQIQQMQQLMQQPFYQQMMMQGVQFPGGVASLNPQQQQQAQAQAQAAAAHMAAAQAQAQAQAQMQYINNNAAMQHAAMVAGGPPPHLGAQSFNPNAPMIMLPQGGFVQQPFNQH
jgi:hypothetical protein